MTTQTHTRSNANPAVIEVNERDFQSQVIERSRTTPVVVDFWAPWCGPCRTLGPTLERLAGEAKGAWVLAKVNVDNNQRLSQAFGIQGIPAVKAFRDGKVAEEFTGALPESRVREWLKRVVPATSDGLLAAAAALEQSNPAEAAARYRLALGEDPSNTAALLSLGRLLVAQGDPEGVEALRQVPAGTPQYPRAQAWLTLADFFNQAGEKNPWLDQLGSENPDSSEARYRVAARHAREGRNAEAISQLLAIVERDRAFRDDAARKTLLALFEALGDDPLVAPARRRLANALF
ncbi:MAG TPA: tetratricopeptide repeat protein [Roseiflexaceae bacterium]|nr:tetratricopeptide repeat protein [Roseiflexaceae bacterium]